MSWGGRNDHDNMVGRNGANCNTAAELLRHPQNWGNAQNPGAITDAIQAFHNGECDKLTTIQRLLRLMQLLMEK